MKGWLGTTHKQIPANNVGFLYIAQLGRRGSRAEDGGADGYEVAVLEKGVGREMSFDFVLE